MCLFIVWDMVLVIRVKVIELSQVVGVRVGASGNRYCSLSARGASRGCSCNGHGRTAMAVRQRPYLARKSIPGILIGCFVGVIV